MNSKKRHEGYLYISNGDGAPPSPWLNGRKFAVAGRKPREESTVTCSHCQRVFLKNTDRVRERAWCWNCDHYICDSCGAVRSVAGCKTFQAILDEAERKAYRHLGR